METPQLPRESARDTLIQIAQIYPNIFDAMTFGDTDHDGRNEVLLYVNDNFTYHYRILEENLTYL
jgi:hypothetical protein